MHAAVVLKKGEGRTLTGGGLWVYDNEIDQIPLELENGALVDVYAFNGYPLGTGYLNRRSKITIRLLSRVAGEQIDRTFLRKRMDEAIEYRAKMMDMESCRLVFGEADFLPGFVLDKFGDVLVFQCLTLGMEKLKDILLEAAADLLLQRQMPVRGIYERSDAKVRRQEGLDLVRGFWSEPFPTKVSIQENGVRYLVDVAEGQKTGFFLDQKLNRKAIWPFAKGKEVLDCFTHTGSFALNAGLAGAKTVLGVDASQTAIEQARENAELNGLENRVHFQCGDAFELLPKLEEEGRQFDLVILDPPAFAKSREHLKNAIKGYREVNLRGLKLVRDGGYLATCSCSHFMTPPLFEKMLTEAARGAHVILRQVEYRAQSPDHPVLWGEEQSHYLKFYIVQVLRQEFGKTREV